MPVSDTKSGESWLLHFEKPTAVIFGKLKRLFSEMNASRLSETRQRSAKNATFHGSLDGLVSELSSNLEADYSSNTSEKDVPWKFDYVVCHDKRYVDAVQILTRLYNPAKPGNIFYGRLIKRIDRDRFLMWIDD